MLMKKHNVDGTLTLLQYMNIFTPEQNKFDTIMQELQMAKKKL